MKISVSSFFSLSILLLPPAFSQGVPPSGPSNLVDVLAANDLSAFSSLLQTQAPDLYSQLVNREEPDVTLFVPPGDFPIELARRQINQKSRLQASLYALGCTKAGSGDADEEEEEVVETEEEPAATTNTTSPTPEATGVQRRQLPDFGDIDPSNFERRQTFLDDPDYINLGPNTPLNWVSNYVAPENGTGNAVIQFISGNNSVVQTVRGPIKYDRGIIYVLDKWPSLPGTFSDTLESAGRTDFLTAVRAANLEAKLNDTPKITVFVISNGNDFQVPVASMIVENFLAYSTDLQDGETLTASDGSTLTITLTTQGMFVNGYRVTNPNVPIKNGIVHYLKNDTPVKAAGTSVKKDRGTSLAALCVVCAVTVCLLF